MEVLQKEYIEIRFDELIENTDCSAEFLEVFVSKGIFSKDEVNTIELPEEDTDNNETQSATFKAKKFYKIIIEKPGSYDVLMEALEITDQIDVLDLLEEYYDDGDIKEEPQCWTASIERLKQSALKDEANAVLENDTSKTSKCPLEATSTPTDVDIEGSNAKRRKTETNTNPE